MYQMDPAGSLRPLMLMNELQSVAGDHAEILGVGMSFCIKNNLAWVALFFHVDIIRMPAGQEEITIETWPSSRDALRTTRDYIIKDAAGETLVRATSQWVMIDIEKRRPAPLAGRLPEFELSGERALETPFDKFPDFAPDFSESVKPRYDDFDINQHLNNAVYAVWATEALGIEFREKHKLRGISLNFKKEIPMDGADIKVETLREGLKTRHRIVSGDAVNAYVMCEWNNAN
jgi:acyl-ACP thioesterase